MNATVVGLTAVVVAVTGETPRVLVVRPPSPAAAEGVPAPHRDALPFGPFEPEHHRTLESGLRSRVERQTGLPLRYVEQLYTFGDRFRDHGELAGGPRVVSVGYLALVREAPLSGAGEAEWRDWYEFLPWEDWRGGRPPLVDRVIRPALRRWIDAVAGDAESGRRAERVGLSFGPEEEDAGWDFERALERYELLYEAGLLVEAQRDRDAIRSAGRDDPVAGRGAEIPRALGKPMAADSRRILASALGRLRGKLKYRPLVFELLPPTFTLFRLQQVVEALSGVGLHKQNFRRLVIAGGLVEPTGQVESRTGGRPAELFRFRRDVLRERASPGVGVPAVRVAD
ncbi:NUDIX hydrolase [Skermanella pratensis]|uniref:NUDIX hydrolase n=1 Tax=Skermanella pratensis TaxID=2233999 RepID=UPI00130139C4|nr:hypothetical protein [Skermanella pratensis]